LSAFDLQTQNVSWFVDLPGNRDRYQRAPSRDEVWTSADGRLVYVTMSDHRLVVLDAVSRTVVREVDPDLGCVSNGITLRPQPDEVVLVCGDQVRSTNVTTGVKAAPRELPASGSAAAAVSRGGLVKTEGAAIARNITDSLWCGESFIRRKVSSGS
jgi:hypothetical protein